MLTFKTSGVFNFAHGALATIAAYLGDESLDILLDDEPAPTVGVR